ncbi:MAG TPA: hypothetical protein VF550_07735 [Polyangia bacterium]
MTSSFAICPASARHRVAESGHFYLARSGHFHVAATCRCPIGRITSTSQKQPYTQQLILERGEVPRTDWFSYTNAGRQWIDLYWLFQVGLALLYRIGGVPRWCC